jgi:hypothetical protein
LIDFQGGTLGWVLYKLAEMQDYQQALRKEIQLATINGLDSPDYDKMPLLNAMINVRTLPLLLQVLVMNPRLTGGSAILSCSSLGGTHGLRGLRTSSQPAH